MEELVTIIEALEYDVRIKPLVTFSSKMCKEVAASFLKVLQESEKAY